MALNSQSTNDRLERMETKLDLIKDSQSRLELSLTKKVVRNSLILNGMLWLLALLTTAGVVELIRHWPW